MPAIARPVESFRNKAELGNVDAQWRLGLMYHSGQGVTKSEAEAQKWYLESG
jgi:TPR repeat protein